MITVQQEVIPIIQAGYFNPYDGYYYENGQKSNKTGLTMIDGTFYNLEQGKLKTEPDLVEYNGAQFFTINGQVATSANGLTLVENEFYFLAGGQVQVHIQRRIQRYLHAAYSSKKCCPCLVPLFWF